MERPKFSKVTFNKEHVKGLTLKQFVKQFEGVYAGKGIDLEAEYYALFPSRKKEKKEPEELNGNEG